MLSTLTDNRRSVDDGCTVSRVHTQIILSLIMMRRPANVEVTELNADDRNKPDEIRTFSLSADGIEVELCTIGASITKLMVPSYRESSKQVNDVVLGYTSPSSMLDSSNPPYFGVVVGRVANRIAKGTFTLPDESGSRTSYNLDINNGPNHLHGGNHGFSHCIWDAEIVSIPTGEANDPNTSRKGVQFSLVSKDGDQGYPGKILVTATYSLIPKKGGGAALRLVMKARLGDDGKATPINLAQHTYFNLASHDDPEGVLGHWLKLPSQKYTPIDDTSIPTREVRSVATDLVMDWRSGKRVRDALIDYGTEKASLSEEKAKKNVTLSRCGPNIVMAGDASPTPEKPYGFDHNYVVEQVDKNGLNMAAVLQHGPTNRRLTVWTDAPGLQLYTGNYLNGVSPDKSICKSTAGYGPWQAICLETQHFPDSILTEPDAHEEFARGKCTILHPGGPDYSHTVEYHFEPIE